MTITKAQNVTGLIVLQSQAPGRLLGFRAVTPDGEIIAEACGYKLTQVLTLLVGRVFSLTRKAVIQEQGGRCWHCNLWCPSTMECDHIIPRSDVKTGRNDRRENLRGLCGRCHRKRTAGEILAPNPSVLARVRAYGWEWDCERPGWIGKESL